MAQHKPLVIAVDGVDYSGKSTLISKIVEVLDRCGVKSQVVGFPTSENFGAKAREFIRAGDPDQATNFLAADFQANLIELARQPIVPEVLIYDRFYATTIALQGMERFVYYAKEHNLFGLSLLPDFYVCLGINYHEACKRAQNDKDSWDYEFTQSQMGSESDWRSKTTEYLRAATKVTELINATSGETDNHCVSMQFPDTTKTTNPIIDTILFGVGERMTAVKRMRRELKETENV